MEARSRSSFTGSTWFDLVPQRKLRRRDHIRLRQILGHAYAHRVAPIFIIAARGQPHVPCQHYRVQRAARQVVHRCQRFTSSGFSNTSLDPPHSVLTAARERRLRQIEPTSKAALACKNSRFDLSMVVSGPPEMSRGAKSLGGFICSVCLRCPAHEPAASRPLMAVGGNVLPSRALGKNIPDLWACLTA